MKAFLLILVILNSTMVLKAQNLDDAFKYYDAKQYDKAAKEFEKNIPEVKQLYGKNDTTVYSILLFYCAVCYDKINNFSKAESYYIQTKEIYENINGVNNVWYGIAINTLSSLYQNHGEYDKALKLRYISLENTEFRLGKNSQEYSIRLKNLTELYLIIGQYDQALSKCHEALESAETTFGKGSSAYGIFLNDLGIVYAYLGQYDEALPVYFEALAIEEKYLGKNNPEYGTTLNNIGSVYEHIGKYDEALKFYILAVDITEISVGKQNKSYATYLSNLAGIYRIKDENNTAIQLYNESLEIVKNNLGTSHPLYGLILNNIAVTYSNMANYEKSIEIYFDALQLTEETLGKNHPYYISRLNNLGDLYCNLQNFDKALPLLKEALTRCETILGINHPTNYVILSNLISVYNGKGEFDKVYFYLKESINNIFVNINHNFSFMSEKDKETYLHKYFYDLEADKSFFLRYSKINPTVGIDAYNLELLVKNLILQSGINIRQVIIDSEDTEALILLDEWYSINTIISKQNDLPIIERRKDLNTIVENADNIERKLANLSSKFSNLTSIKSINWKDVQKSLKSNEVAIEFTSFCYYTGKEFTDSSIYVALVLRPEDEYPQLIELFEQRQLDSVLSVMNVSNSQTLNNLYRSSFFPDKEITNYGKRLYDLIWEPISSLITDKTTVYFSPSGMLNQIAFAAIPYDSTKLLSDKYQLIQLTSTSMLAQKSQFTDEKPPSITLFGGINYDAEVDEIVANAQKIENTENFYSRSTPSDIGLDGVTWNYLPGTLQEVESISKQANDANIKVAMYTGSYAIEEQLKNQKGKASPRIIHIATHGFFLAKQKNYYSEIKDSDSTYYYYDNPLNRSGLIFAGANRDGLSKKNESVIDDGILTAYEVANITLINTQLVVLSACESGLGDIRGSEGVFGLQRAFKAAGVEYIIMSLWKIPDAETAEFMKYFYTKLFSGSSIEISFKETQNFMKIKYPNEPYKWAAFVLVR